MENNINLEDIIISDDQDNVNQDYTARFMSSDLEKIMYKAFRVLDHGFIRVVDYMGNDDSIVQAARVSYGRGTKKSSQDSDLINYLMRHSHTTPFEMCEIKFHIKLPIFIARQWIRHRTASVNEYSARYSILDNEFYLPNPNTISTQSSVNKQGRENAVSKEEAEYVINIIKSDSERCYGHYIEMINAENSEDKNREGIARELARINLTLNCYTQFYWKIDLHNLFHFLKLRLHKGAQFEIAEYARIMLAIVKTWVPYAHDAFINYKLHAGTISKRGIEVIKKMMAGTMVSQSDSGMSKREWNELTDLLGIA